MEIINPAQIFWQAVNFLLLLIVISKFVVPPMQKFLAKRAHDIEQGIKNAEQVKKQLSEAETMKNEILAEAKAQASKIVEEMRLRSEEMSKKLESDARETAHNEAKRIVAQAEHAIASQKQALEDEAVKLASLIARKALSESLSVEMSHDLLQKKLEQLKNARITQ